MFVYVLSDCGCMSRQFKAVGFDMDGTFLRTHVDYAKLADVDRIVMERHGIPFDEVDFQGRTKRLRAPIRDWMEAHGRADEWPRVYREIDDLACEVECEYVDEAVPFSGVVDALGEIEGMGLRTGILTRGCREYARRALGPLYGRFYAVMGRDYSFYDDAKPSPIAMRQFASELGVEPCEILYVGDNLTDWMSARDAGSAFAGVLTGSCTRDDWISADPGITVIDSAADVVALLRSP